MYTTACVRKGKGRKNIEVSLIEVKEGIMNELQRVFFHVARDFSIGSKIRPEGRAPYFHLLYWLSKSEDWSLNINDIVLLYPKFKGSINQVVDKGFLASLIENNVEIKKNIHFDVESKILSIEDPKFLFYLRNLLWTKFGKKLGFLNLDISSNYDFALSFAGEQRVIAEKLFDKLTEGELEVFYDKNEQHSILATNVEEYLAPIYNSEAEFVIVLLSKEYPTKIWTKFESEQFKERFGEESVIPIWFSNVELSMFDETKKLVVLHIV